MPTVSNSNNDSPNTQSSSTTNVRASYRNRTSSNHSSADSRESDHPDSIPPSVRSALLRTENIPDGLSSGNGSRGSLRSRRNSHSGTVGDPFPSRSRTVHDLPFDTAPNVFRLNGENTGPMSASPLSLERDVEPNLFPFPSDRHERVGLGMEPWENVGQVRCFLHNQISWFIHSGFYRSSRADLELWLTPTRRVKGTYRAPNIRTPLPFYRP